MTDSDTGSIRTTRLWGDFRAFLAGNEPTDERIAVFAAKVEEAEGCDTYGFPAAGCGAAIIVELNRRIAA